MNEYYNGLRQVENRKLYLLNDIFGEEVPSNITEPGLAEQMRSRVMSQHNPLLQEIYTSIPGLYSLTNGFSVMNLKGSGANDEDIDEACTAFSRYLLSEDLSMSENS